MSGLAIATAYEFKLFPIPVKTFRGSFDEDKFTDQLNALGAEGWHVVAPMMTKWQGTASPGTTHFVMQREVPDVIEDVR